MSLITNEVVASQQDNEECIAIYLVLETIFIVTFDWLVANMSILDARIAALGSGLEEYFICYLTITFCWHYSIRKYNIGKFYS